MAGDRAAPAARIRLRADGARRWSDDRGKPTISDSAGVSKGEFQTDDDLPSDLASLFDTDVAERRSERELEHSLHNLEDLAEAESRR